jgi:hypothetical protein
LRAFFMHKFKFLAKGMIGAASAATVVLGLTGLTNATQVVAPALTATGASINGSTQSVGANSTFTFYGLYSDDNTNPESGLGVKVLYNGQHLTNATITEEYTKCRIAAAQVQDPTTATAKAVMGWIDTALRPTGVVGTATGAVGWPNLADLTSGGCLNPGNINGAANAGDNSGAPAATSGTPLKLFRFTATMAASCTTPAACSSQVQIVSDGNFSYAGGTPGFTNQSFTVQGAAAPQCDLDVDGSGTRQALVDGVLLVRAMLGVSGAAYTSGITFPGAATRTTETAVKNFITARNYDVDGSGTQQALVDGVVLVRLMLGVTNTSLLTGVTLPGSATITTAAGIRANVNTRCGTSF